MSGQNQIVEYFGRLERQHFLELISCIRALEKELDTTLIIPEEPQITGALGAALIAARRMSS